MVNKERLISVLMGTPWKRNDEGYNVVDYETWAANIMELLNEAKTQPDIR